MPVYRRSVSHNSNLASIVAAFHGLSKAVAALTAPQAPVRAPSHALSSATLQETIGEAVGEPSPPKQDAPLVIDLDNEEPLPEKENEAPKAGHKRKMPQHTAAPKRRSLPVPGPEFASVEKPTQELQQRDLEEAHIAARFRSSAAVGETRSTCESVVILCTGLSEGLFETVREVTRSLGGKLVKRMSETVTHVITRPSSTDMRAPRTLKYLQAVQAGCWIVSYEWIEACSTHSQWVAEDAFEVLGDNVSGTGGPEKGRKRRESGEERLLGGCVLSLWGRFLPPGLKKTEIKALAIAGGAVVQDWDKGSSTRRPTAIIVAGIGEGHKAPPRVPDSVPVATANWLLDSIGNYERQPLESYMES